MRPLLVLTALTCLACAQPEMPDAGQPVVTELAVCDWAALEGLVLLFTPPWDGGALAPGRFPVSSTSVPPEGSVVATVNTNRIALDGSVTLTSLSPPTGTFELEVGGASASGGVVQGSFEAVPCTAP